VTIPNHHSCLVPKPGDEPGGLKGNPNMRRIVTKLAAGSLILSVMAGCAVIVPSTPATEVAKPASQKTEEAKPATPVTEEAKPATPVTGVIRPSSQKTEEAKPASVFAGIWNTTFGKMTLNVDGIRVTGTYDGGTIAGTTSDDGLVLKATWTEGSTTGPVTFTVSQDGNTITGVWSVDGTSIKRKDWTGTKIK
jgi:hypothetical protein